MEFKYPYLLFGLFAWLIPILVHLFQWRRFTPYRFTNVAFLQQLVLQTRKSAKLKKWLLLMVRCLLVAALVGAVAQPFFPNSASSQARELVFVLDQSYSMQAKGQKGTLWQQAVQELLTQIPPQTAFSLLTSDRAYWNTDAHWLQSELLDIQPSHQPFKLQTVLQQWFSAPHPPRDVVVLTDGIGVRPEQISATYRQNDQWHIVSFKPEKRDNVSVDSVWLTQADPGFQRMHMQLTAYTKAPIQVPIRVTTHKGQILYSAKVQLQSGRKILSFLLTQKEAQGTVSIEDQSLTYDNHYFFTYKQQPKIKVLVLGPIQASAYLERIYTPDWFELKRVDLPQLDYRDLQQPAVIILHQLEQLPAALTATLLQRIEKGVVLVGVPGLKTPLPAWQQFWQQWQLQCGLQWDHTTRKLLRINFDHPLFQNTFVKRTQNFQYPQMGPYLAVRSNWLSVLRFDENHPFLLSRSLPNSRLLVSTSPMVAEGNNFTQSPLVVPTFLHMGLWGQNQGWQVRTLGDPTPFTIPLPTSSDAMVSLSGNGKSLIPVQEQQGGTLQLYFDQQPLQPGNYQLVMDRKNIDQLSFNALRNESDMMQTEADWRGFNKYNNVESVMNQLQFERHSASVWQWLLAFALCCIMAELAIQKWVK